MEREEAISEWTFRSDHIKKWLDEYGEEPSIRHYVELIDMAIEALQDRPKGEWIESEMDKDFRVCSVCKNKGYKDRMAWRTEFIKSYLNFCPNCGARMTPYKGGEDDNA